MAAGLGFKTFTTGEVLSASDVNGYLMQGVLVFASTAARDAAITSPQEGQFAYLKDTNVTTYYTGSAWTNLDTTGMVNPMTTTGDTIYSSSGSTPARLGIGSTGQVLTVAGGIPSWATASSGSMTSLANGSLSGTSLNLTSISGDYNDLRLELEGISVNVNASLKLEINGLTFIYGAFAGEGSSALTGNYNIAGANQFNTTNTNGFVLLQFYDYANTTSYKKMSDMFVFRDTGATNFYIGETSGAANTTAAINQITVTVSGGNSFDAGTYRLYGVK